MDIFPQFPHHLLIISGPQLLFSVKSVNFLNPWNYDTPNWASNLRFLSWAKHYLKKCPNEGIIIPVPQLKMKPQNSKPPTQIIAVLKNKSDFVAGSIVLTLNTITICIYIYILYYIYILLSYTISSSWDVAIFGIYVVRSWFNLSRDIRKLHPITSHSNALQPFMIHYTTIDAR